MEQFAGQVGGRKLADKVIGTVSSEAGQRLPNSEGPGWDEREGLSHSETGGEELFLDGLEYLRAQPSRVLTSTFSRE